MPIDPASSAAGPTTSRIVAPADQPAQSSDQHRERHVCRDHAAAHPRAGPLGDDARADHHRNDRPEAEHHQRIANQPVPRAPAPVQRLIFGDRQRSHVAHSSPLQIAGCSVVDRVIVAPTQERREQEQPEGRAHPPVRAAGPQKRAVRAVVEDDERPHEQRGGRDRKRDHQDHGDPHRKVHRDRKEQIGHRGRRDVDEGPTRTRLGVGRENLLPGGVVQRVGCVLGSGSARRRCSKLRGCGFGCCLGGGHRTLSLVTPAASPTDRASNRHEHT